MNIKIENKNDVEFAQIKYTEIFTYGENKYMRIPEVIDNAGNRLGNAINIENGYLISVVENTKVISHPNSELIIK